MIAELLPADPELMGPYRLIARLGAGGMGQVYLARSPGGRLVAVKVIRPELAGDEQFRARFAREVTAARNVSGMFTALVVDADVDGPVPWLATVYVPGPSLADAVGERGPLPVGSLRALAAGLAEGLQAIHAAGLVHRDLKPTNVLLAQDGPRVIDFGISRAVEASVLTVTGAVVGSPGYMSPEQARGRVVGPPSDVFSLGAVLTFAATGRHPFGTGPAEALLYRVVREEPDLSAVPPRIRPLIVRCLAKDPRMRPSPGQLLAELGPGEITSGWLPQSIAGTFGRYEPAGHVAALETAAARRQPDRSPLAGPAPGSPQPSQSPRKPQPTLPPRSRGSRGRRLALAGTAAAVAVAVAAVATVLSLETPAPRHFSASGPTPGLFSTSTPSASPAAKHSHTAAPAASGPAQATQPGAAKSRPRPGASASVRASVSPGASPSPAASSSAQPGLSASAEPSAPEATLASTDPSPSPTPSQTLTASGYTFTYSGATTYSCSTTDFPIAIGPVEPFDFVNDSSAAIEVGQQTVSPGDTYTPANSRMGDLYTVATDSGSCLIIFGQSGSGQVVVS